MKGINKAIIVGTLGRDPDVRYAANGSAVCNLSVATSESWRDKNTGQPDGKYIWQMMAQMACTDRGWCDFVSFDDRMPEPLQFKCIRIHRDEEAITSMISGVLQFLAELDALEAEMKTKMGAA